MKAASEDESMRWERSAAVLAFAVMLGTRPPACADDPPNPFGKTTSERTDAIPGWLELSDGTAVRGKIYLTRGQGLRIFDQEQERVREIPLAAATEICVSVDKEWIEKEWRFKENASDAKLYTGRTYPARLYRHEIKLKRGGSINGALAGIVYVEPDPPTAADPSPAKGRKASSKRQVTPPKIDGAEQPKRQRLFLHKRDKGEFGQTLEQLVYVKRIVLSGEAPKTNGKPTP
jgi:hypothetical protein